MRIAIIGPNSPIPPVGWGAVESLIWDYKCMLEKMGCNILIVHEHNDGNIIAKVNEFQPDIVHIHYDDFWYLWDKFQCKNVVITNHYAYLEHPGLRKVDHLNGIAYSNALIHCLSPGIEKVYQQDFHVPRLRTFVLPNGANDERFQYREQPLYPNQSIYLAKIDYRKRQHIYQNIHFIDFVGNLADPRFQVNRRNYKGEWNKEELYENLTNYANLVLLSDGEAHPLVCCEALVAGLGLVVSEFAAANLDTSLPWIDVIPNGRLHDIEYIKGVILENQRKSVMYRHEIRKYGLENFTWKVILQKYLEKLQNYFGITL